MVEIPLSMGRGIMLAILGGMKKGCMKERSNVYDSRFFFFTASFVDYS